MNKAIIILTEGSQDAAFIYKILTTNNFENYDKSLMELDEPINKIILEHVKDKYPNNNGSEENDDSKIKFETSLFLPYILRNKEKTDYVIIYSIGGNKDFPFTEAIFLKYFTEIFSLQTNKIKSFAFAFIFDNDSSQRTYQSLHPSASHCLHHEFLSGVHVVSNF